ncbi:hypothetical protein NLJ89_g7262 [Agrocybe chaxingu]|uniref:Uncharacterized protein n=1 Tax=Agrocybe chaxingu TaxID=84603 RepID=A0A9W8JUW3_9AGAR|nr:hypothetical protein NLJ89_g7262 [Agrocybe chaxingu]
MLNSTLLPTYFNSPLITTIPSVKYAANGRQMSFAETEVQRLERLAFANASRSRSCSPTQSRNTFSGDASPKMQLISEPYGDPIELMANRLAEELSISSDEFSSSSDEEFHIFYSTPRRAPSPSSRKSSFKPGHRRKRSSLSSIPEED